MSQLRKGKMTGQEIAEWFGISYNTYSNRRKSKLEILKRYAKFTTGQGYINIEEIYYPEYAKGFQSNDNDKRYVKNLLEKENGLMSVAGLSKKQKYIDQYEDCQNITERALEDRNAHSRNILFGKPNVKSNPESKNSGLLGSCYYVWAIKVDDFNNYRYMDNDEYAVYLDLLSNSKITFNYADLALQASAYKKNEMTAEDFFNKAVSPELISNTFYTKIIQPFKRRTGEILVHATKHEVEESMRKRAEELAGNT